jgi:hypothetical protein
MNQLERLGWSMGKEEAVGDQNAATLPHQRHVDWFAPSVKLDCRAEMFLRSNNSFTLVASN